MAPSYTSRQELLLSSAARLVAGSGLRGLTHRGVDREAGLPEGTCSAYLRTREALLTSLTEYVIEQFSRDIAEVMGRIEQQVACRPADTSYAADQLGAMLRRWLSEPDLLLVRIELTVEGVRRPGVGHLMQAQARHLTDMVTHALRAAGHERADTRATTLVAAIDGLLLRALREPPRQRSRLVAESLGLLLDSLTVA